MTGNFRSAPSKPTRVLSDGRSASADGPWAGHQTRREFGGWLAVPRLRKFWFFGRGSSGRLFLIPGRYL